MSDSLAQELVTRVVEGENPYDVIDETLNGIELYEDETGIYFVDENDENVYIKEEDLKELGIEIDEETNEADSTPETSTKKGKKKVIKMNPFTFIDPAKVKLQGKYGQSPIPRTGKGRHHAKILALRAIAASIGRKKHGAAFMKDIAGKEAKKAAKKARAAKKK
jgi:hypothetical protein